MSDTEVVEARVPLEDRLVSATVGALEMFSIHIGRQLGLYRALAAATRTPGELATEAGIHPRYAREWLEQQAVAGFLTVDDASAAEDQRGYGLDPQVAAIFTVEDDPRYVAPLAGLLVGIGQTLDQVIDAYRTGAGVPFADYGPHLMNGQGDINRPAFVNDLVPAWIGSIEGLTDRLAADGTIGDLGCGTGWAAIAMASRLPGATVTGWDSDPASIEAARRNAASAGVAVHFEAVDATTVGPEGTFDLITILEALHDMSDPVGVLRAAGAALADDGVVLVADEKVSDVFTAPGDELERLMYGWSITHCLPAAMAEQPSAALGTVLRAPIVHRLAAEAGFPSAETLDADAGFFQLHVLRGWQSV